MKHPHIWFFSERYGPAGIWTRHQSCLFCKKRRYPIYTRESVRDIEKWTYDDSQRMSGVTT